MVTVEAEVELLADALHVADGLQEETREAEASPRVHPGSTVAGAGVEVAQGFEGVPGGVVGPPPRGLLHLVPGVEGLGEGGVGLGG